MYVAKFEVDDVTFDRTLQMADAIGAKAKVNYKQTPAKAG
jgi:hypothetical protein